MIFLKIFVALVLATTVLNVQGQSTAIFRTSPTGWTCGDPEERMVSIPYSVSPQLGITNAITNIVDQCQSICSAERWCRAYSLVNLPVDDSFGSSMRSGSAICLLYKEILCQVLRWPGADSTVISYKIPTVEGYDRLEQKCQARFHVYMAGPPETCAQACDYSPNCIGFNFKFAENVCFLINSQSDMGSSRQGCPSSLGSDPFQVFYSKQRVAFQSQLNDPISQQLYPGFIAHNGNCRGGVASDLSPLAASGANAVVPVYTCPGCEATVETCIDTCRQLSWCQGVSIFVGAKVDYVKPLCLLKPVRCDPSQIDRNAVYRFFEKVQ